jgi:hypothetical protein
LNINPITAPITVAPPTPVAVNNTGNKIYHTPYENIYKIKNPVS